MTTVAERAIDRDVARLRRENVDDFRDHDWPMRTSRRSTRRQHLRDGLAITRRVAFLVFLFETARIFSTIPRTSAMNVGLGRVHCEVIA